MIKIEYNTEYNDKQIKYLFQRLITALCLSSHYNLYEEDHSSIEEILCNACNWFETYLKEQTFKFVNESQLAKYEDILYELDGKYLSVDGIFIEESYEWILQLKNMIKKEK